jgi:cathepsin B
MNEIFTNGPVVATFAVYDDFWTYSSGIYNHTHGELTDYHAVKIVGWGETATGIKFWRVANSWSAGWGERGFFSIIRGTNNAQFEQYIVSVTSLKD